MSQITYYRNKIIERILNNSEDPNQDISQIKINLDTINQDVGDNPLDQIVVPNAIKPYINRTVNFELFQEILTDRVDKLRIKLDLE